MKRLRNLMVSKYFLIPTVSLVLYALLGFVLTPFAVRWYVPKYARDHLHCQASLGKVRVNPFVMSFEASGFNLAGPEGAMIAGFERLFVDFEMASLFRWAAVFREFRLEKPVIHMVMEPDGSMNLTRLAPESTEQKPEATQSKSIGLILESVAIADGEVTLTDKRKSTPVVLTFQDLDLDFDALSTLRDRNGTYSLAASTADGETVQWAGEIGLVPFRSSGKVAFSGIQAATLWRFVQHSVRLDPPSGKLDLSTDYRIDLNETPLQLWLENSRVDLSALALNLSGTKEPFLELKKIEIDCALFDLAARTLEVTSLLVDGGRVQVRIDEAGQSNLQQIVLETPAQGAKEPTQEAKSTIVQDSSSDDAQPWTVNVGAIEMKDIALDLEDRSRPSPMAAGISSVSLLSKVKIEAGLEANAWVQQLAADLKGVRVGSTEAPTPLFEAQQLTLEGGEIDLGAQTIMVSRIGLGNGHLDVAREKDGTLNVEKLFASATEGSDAPETSSEASKGHPWKFLLKTFELTGFRSALSDHTFLPEKPLYNIQNLHVRATEIDGKSPMGLEMSFGIEQGGNVALRGKVDPAAQSVEAEVKVADLVLNPLDSYLASFMTLTLKSAALSSEGTFRYGVPGTGSKLAYEGSFNLDTLSLNQPGSGETYLGWGAMQIPQLKLALEPDKLEISEIKLSKPVGQLIIYEDGTVNLAKILKEQPAETGPPASSKAPAKAQAKEAVKKTPAPSGTSPDKAEDSFPFSIGKVRIQEGDLVFADFSLMPKFMTRIHELKGTVSRLSSSKGSMSEIQLDGRVDRYGMARIRGAIDMSDFTRSTDINLVFQNVEMASVTPYSGKFAGRKIKSGKLSMDLKYRIQNTKLVGDNKVIVDNLVLGEHVDSPDAVNLPLDLAIALLSDSKGRIDIGLPVSGDLNDPQFSIGPLIWKALVTMITKVATAPFRALGALFGGESDGFDAVQFDPGETELLPPEREKLKKVGEVLQKRPQLKLLVQGRYNPETDGMVFKQLSVRLAVAAGMGLKSDSNEDPGALDFSDSKTRRALEKLFTERFGSPALDEIEQAVKRGEIKPPVQDESAEKKKAKKRGGLSGIFYAAKLYKVIPGAKSPEESELMAAELYARLVESEPVSEAALQRLAQNRAQAITVELQNECGVPPERILTVTPESLAEEAGLSAKLSLEALSAAH